MSDPLQAHSIVGWGQGPLRFELQSTDAEILSRASTIVRSWPSNPNARLARTWRLVRAITSEGETLWESYIAEPDGAGERLFRRLPPALAMQAVESDAVRQLLSYPESILGLHGALVSKHDGEGDCGVALIGPCFAGKSTFSCALWSSGWSFLSDDITLFDDEGFAYPAPRRAWMRESSRGLVGEALWSRAQATPSCDEAAGSLLFHPHEIDGEQRPRNTRLAAIVFLARRQAQVGPVELHRLTAVNGAIAMLPYSNIRDLPFPSALSRLAPLAEAVPVYDLGRGSLDAMIARLNGLVATGSHRLS